jgi:hypothetical protein
MKLQAVGVKFDQPYSKTRHASYGSAELTDPVGDVDRADRRSEAIQSVKTYSCHIPRITSRSDS